MKTGISAGLQAHLAGGTTTLATCWKATLTDATIVAATSHDRNITFDGVLYLSTAAYTPTDIESGSNMSPDNLELEGFLASPAITEQDLHTGRWDYAAVEIFTVNYNDLTQGRDRLREGTLGQVTAGRGIFRAELRGLMQQYSRKIIALISKDCRADLGDSRCGVDLTPHTYTTSVSAVSGNRVITADGIIRLTDWFTGGLVTFTSGLNDGLSMEVKQSDGPVLTLHQQMAFLIAEDDTFTVSAGCAKRFYEDCIRKFNNAVNFRAEPHLPGAAVYGGPGTKILIAPEPTPIPTPAPFPSPAPTPAPSPAAGNPGSGGGVVAPPASSVSLSAYGTQGTGVDNQTAFEDAIADAFLAGHKTVYVGPGRWEHSGVIHVDGVKLVGAGLTSIVYGTDYVNTSLWIEGDGAEISSLKITGAQSPTRLAALPATRIAVMGGATNWRINNNYIEHAPAASIHVREDSGDGEITYNTIVDSLADSIHMTDGAHDILVEGNYIENSGDDGIACVSYTTDTNTVNNITARYNVVKNNVWGRNMSVDGGDTILYEYNWLDGNSQFAGLILLSESNVDWQTKATTNVIARYNTIDDCGSTVTGHAAVMIYSESLTNDNITVERSYITQDGSKDGMRYFGPQTDVLLDSNRIENAGTDYVGGVDPDVTIIPWTTGPAGYAPPEAAPQTPVSSVMGVYFEVYFGEDITQVPETFNTVYAFHAKPNGTPVSGSYTNQGNGSWQFQNFDTVTAARVQTVRARGQRVILTLGGAQAGYVYDNRTKSDNALASIYDIIAALGGIDGIDWNNYEARIMAPVQSAFATEMIYMSDALKTQYGSDFIISTPCQPSYPEDRFVCEAMVDAGVLDYAAPQFYDWDGFNAAGVISGRIAEWVTLIGAPQVVVGLGASYSNGPSLADCQREWNTIKTAHPTIRGMFGWSHRSNFAAGNVWGTTMEGLL